MPCPTCAPFMSLRKHSFVQARRPCVTVVPQCPSCTACGPTARAHRQPLAAGCVHSTALLLFDGGRVPMGPRGHRLLGPHWTARTSRGTQVDENTNGICRAHNGNRPSLKARPLQPDNPHKTTQNRRNPQSHPSTLVVPRAASPGGLHQGGANCTPARNTTQLVLPPTAQTHSHSRSHSHSCSHSPSRIHAPTPTSTGCHSPNPTLTPTLFLQQGLSMRRTTVVMPPTALVVGAKGGWHAPAGSGRLMEVVGQQRGELVATPPQLVSHL